MDINEFLKLASLFPETVNEDLLFKISSFLLYAPRFKNDILLAQPSTWPATEPPLFLPQSVSTLLSSLCESDSESINKLWFYLKDTVWHYDERVKVVEDRLRVYGKDLGYGKPNGLNF